MSRIIAALAILIALTSAAAAQNVQCANRPTSDNSNACANTRFVQSVAGGSVGGTNGQIQYNNAGAFGGFTMSGDCATTTSTGVIVCTKTNNVSFGPLATATGLVIGSTLVGSGTTTNILYNNAGTLGEYSVATNANIWAGTASKILEAGNVFNSAGQMVALTGTSTVTPDFSTGFNFTFTATTATNYTLANPTNPKVGQTGCIYLLQPASGTVVTITYGGNWKSAGGSANKLLTATLSAVDRICYLVRTTTFIDFTLANAIQ